MTVKKNTHTKKKNTLKTPRCGKWEGPLEVSAEIGQKSKQFASVSLDVFIHQHYEQLARTCTDATYRLEDGGIFKIDGLAQ